MLSGLQGTGAGRFSALPAAGDRSAGMSRSRNRHAERRNQVVRVRLAGAHAALVSSRVA
jgi:hypothetical protein